MLLSTLHTNDAIGAIPRLVDMQIEPFLISSSLNLIVAQRLVRKSCEHCQVKKLLPVKMESEVILELQKIPAASLPRDISLTLPLQVTVGEGCQHCDNTGYRGRIAILETVEVTERLKEIIASGEINHYSVVQEELRSQGMIAMKQDGFIKALRGATTIEEVWTATKE
jgi:type IV pilus assembly protein PilB